MSYLIIFNLNEFKLISINIYLFVSFIKDIYELTNSFLCISDIKYTDKKFLPISYLLNIQLHYLLESGLKKIEIDFYFL